MINKGIGFCQQCLCFPYGCEDEHHALVAFAVLTMRHSVCALLGAISARVAFVLLLPLRRSVHFVFISSFVFFVCNVFLLCPVHAYMHTDLALLNSCYNLVFNHDGTFRC